VQSLRKMKPKSLSSKSIAFVAIATCTTSVAHGTAASVGPDYVVEKNGDDPSTAQDHTRSKRNLRIPSNEDQSSKSVDMNPSLSTGIQTSRKVGTPRLLVSGSPSAPGCGGSSGTTHSVYIGCYDDKSNDRAMPFELYGGHSRIKRLGHGAVDCERECSKLGYRYFAREFRGQCFCGNSEAEYSKHGEDIGCDCCGQNVGPGRMCVWEDADHPDSQVEVETKPLVRPQIKTDPHVVAPLSHMSFNLESSHAAGFMESQSSTSKPLGGFRIRLYWENGYNWQDSSKERFWCMECRGDCSNGDDIQIETCDFSSRQKFIAIGKTIRPAANPDHCITTTGYSGKGDPISLRSCNGGSNQNFLELKSYGKFELQPEGNNDRCLSQHHHPKAKEVVYPEKCDKTRSFDTTYWTTY